MLQFFRKDKTYIWTIESHSFDSFRYWDVNNVEISGDPDQYLGSIVYIYIDGELIGSGYVLGYSHSKNTNMSQLEIHPLMVDLKWDFVQNVTLFKMMDDKIFSLVDGSNLLSFDPILINKSFNNDISDIIEDLILSSSQTNLYIKRKIQTGRVIQLDFVNVTILSAFLQVVNDFAWSWFSVVVENDGWVIIGATPILHQFSFWSDILKIEYEKDISEIINFIKFTNKKTGAELIEKDYQNEESIEKYWKRVLYLADERFLHISAVDEYCQNILESKWKSKIKINSIKTLKKWIKIWDKISVSNWEKNFEDELYIDSITLSRDGSFDLDIGTKQTRSDLLIS